MGGRGARTRQALAPCSSWAGCETTPPGRSGGRRRGLLGGRPAAIVTTLAVLRFPDGGGEAELASVHPGHGVDEVRQRTGWDLRVADSVGVTPAPTAEELAEIRRLDPDGFWTRRAV